MLNRHSTPHGPAIRKDELYLLGLCDGDSAVPIARAVGQAKDGRTEEPASPNAAKPHTKLIVGVEAW